LVPDTRQDRSMSDAITTQPVGDEASRLVFQTLQQVLEETLGGCAVSPILHEDVEHDTMLVHRPP
jgi:hypothetical protein